jgi:AmiR/NasT family two-component response regulator
MAAFPDDPPRFETLEDCQTEYDQLHAAMKTRPTIDQAKGILMAQHGCAAEEAFGMLSEASQRSNRKLREVAEGIVESVHEDGRRQATG